MKKRLIVSVAVLAIIVLASTLTAGCKTAEKSAEAIGGEDQARVSDGTLAIDQVGIVPWGPTMSRVVARVQNTSPDVTMVRGTYSATLFDSKDMVLGNDTGAMAPLYPGQQRWFASAAVAPGMVTPPHRADFRVSGMKWQKIAPSDRPTLTMVQSNYIPISDTDAKATGIVHYTGKQTNVRIALTAVTMTVRKTPVEATTTILENLPPGDYPFEMTFLRSGGAPPRFRAMEVTACLLPE